MMPPLVATVKETLGRLQEQEATEHDGLGLISRLTFLLLIQNAGLPRTPQYVLIGLCVVGFIAPGWYRKPWLWLLLSATMIWGHAPQWYAIDNHKYLMTYWCLALGFSTFLLEARKGHAVAFNARWLIFLCFFFATLWKGISPDYLDGRFFTFNLLEDARFYPATETLGGVSEDSLRSIAETVGQLSRSTSRLESVPLPRVGPRLGVLAQAMTWFTIIFEGLIALAFLWPQGQGLSRGRHGLLLLFAAGVYALATVRGFGMLLMVMGVAQCEPALKKTRLLYVGCFALVFLYPIVKSVIL